MGAGRNGWRGGEALIIEPKPVIYQGDIEEGTKGQAHS
jgi:hypothetical protein